MTTRKIRASPILFLIPTIFLIGIAVEGGSVLVWKALRYPYDLKGPARVIDGDTIVVDGRDVRLFGIDAPEKKQTCALHGYAWRAGLAATYWLRAKLSGRTVGCTFESSDRYGRIVGTCYSAGSDINAAIVGAGWALAYRRYSTRYVAAENSARAHNRGIWIGDCVPPWDYRRKKRDK